MIHRDELPDGRRHVRLSEAADALGLPLRTIRSWCDAGKLSYRQHRSGSARLITVATLRQLESEGWPVDWLTFDD